MNRDQTRTVFKKALEWSTYGVALLPATPYTVNSITMILWAFFAIVNRLAYGKEAGRPPVLWGLFLLIAGNFLLSVAGLLYGSDLNEGTAFLGKVWLMFVFPTIFFLFPFPLPPREPLVHRTVQAFFISTLVMCGWLLFHFWRLDLFGRFDQVTSFDSVFRDTADRYTGKHPAYLSVYLGFATVFALCQLLAPGKKPRVRIFYGASAGLFLFILLLLASRTPVIAVLLVLVVFFTRRIRKRPLKGAFIASFMVLAVLAIRFTPAIYSRFRETAQTQISIPKGLEFNSTNLRVGIYTCTWQLIREKPLLGHGPGTEKRLLNACYAQFPTDAYKLTYYNTHNQYANFWLMSGIAGLLLFAGSLVYCFFVAVKKGDDLFLSFLILFAVGFLTENLLMRHGGIVIYYFFICLFLYYHKGRDALRSSVLS